MHDLLAYFIDLRHEVLSNVSCCSASQPGSASGKLAGVSARREPKVVTVHENLA